MVIKSEFGIYRVIERLLKEAKTPLTCNDLFDDPDIKRFAPDANKVSDYLGHMWRRGLIDRYHAPKTSTSFARYAYGWKERPSEAELKPVESAPRPRGVKPQLNITEDGNTLILEFGELTITVRSNR